MNDRRVRVHFLGSGDAFGSGGRFQTCILLRSRATSCLIDCGASSLIAMRREGVEPNQIDTILVSHLHGDHFGGIPFFILDAQLASRRTTPLSIAGPPGIRDRVRAAMEVLFPGSSALKQRFPLTFTELDPESRQQFGPISVRAFPVVHPSGAPSYAVRTELEGRVMVYSGDAEWSENLVEASADADLFICEAYFFDKAMKFHLDYQSLLSQRERLSCRRILLTHMSEDMLARLERLEIEAAYDGLVVTLQ
jgi:ribonuclease BN (tRNA processing enzyme)